MATLVKFLKDSENDVFAYFPQLNYNCRLYGNSMKTSYAHIGQHSSCDKGYANDCEIAVASEYRALAAELKSIGYDLKVLNPPCRVSVYTLPAYWASGLINGEYDNLTAGEEADIIGWLKEAAAGNCVSMSDETNFGRFMGMGCDLAEFTFIKH